MRELERDEYDLRRAKLSFHQFVVSSVSEGGEEWVMKGTGGVSSSDAG